MQLIQNSSLKNNFFEFFAKSNLRAFSWLIIIYFSYITVGNTNHLNLKINTAAVILFFNICSF